MINFIVPVFYYINFVSILNVNFKHLICYKYQCIYVLLLLFLNRSIDWSVVTTFIFACDLDIKHFVNNLPLWLCPSWLFVIETWVLTGMSLNLTKTPCWYSSAPPTNLQWLSILMFICCRHCRKKAFTEFVFFVSSGVSLWLLRSLAGGQVSLAEDVRIQDNPIYAPIQDG